MKFQRIITLFTSIFICVSGYSQGIPFYAETTSGCDSLLVTFNYIPLPGSDTILTFDWDFGNGQTASGKTSQTVLYDSPGLYTVSVTINNNTTISRYNYISVYSTPSPFFNFSDSIETGSFSVVFRNVNQLTDTIEYTYHWDFDDGDTANTRIVIHTFQEEGTYNVHFDIANPLGCSASMERIVEIRDTLFLPNVFSPNGDNINDYFIVATNGLTVYSIKIYSKTGMLVYRAESPTIIWDGRNMAGQELPPSTYYFVVHPVDGTSTYKQHGFIKLFR